jgi:anti-anti-sigma regulatory factor
MLPSGIELRPEFSTNREVLAFGFSGKQVNDVQAIELLAKELIEYVDKVTSPPHFVVLDMRNLARLSFGSLEPLLKIRQRLSKASWRLLLVIDEPAIRDVLIATGLDKVLVIAIDKEVGRLLASSMPPSQQATVPTDEGVEFTAEELLEITNHGITLDDAIGEIEKLRS